MLFLNLQVNKPMQAVYEIMRTTPFPLLRHYMENYKVFSEQMLPESWAEERPSSSEAYLLLEQMLLTCFSFSFPQNSLKYALLKQKIPLLLHSN